MPNEPKPAEQELRNQDDQVPFMYDYLNRVIRKRPEIIPYSFRFGDVTNYFQISPTGHATFSGSATVFDDLRTSGTSVKIGASAPDLVTFAPATTNLQLYGFDGINTSEQVFFAIQLPHSYKEGTNITPHIHWSPTTADAGNVKWFLEYTWANNGVAFAAPTTITVTGAAGGTAWMHNKHYFSDIVGTGKTISSMLICRLYRNPADAADTYEHDAALLEFDFHYEMDSVGSQTASSKT
ncbi:MAG: hypothetical protein WC479_11060 [Candidatus Izemoplasmatales bacterium]|jgi:hypothetical protein